MIQKLKPKSDFSRNVLTLMTGTTIAQAIPVAISPILTRIYTPEDFGVLALFVALMAIFSSIANARYELAIMLPKKDEDAINIFALGFIITSTISCILLILVILFNDLFVKILNNKEIGTWLYFIPIAVFFSGIFNILNYFNNRKKNYKDIANSVIIKSIVLAIVQVSIGIVKSGASGLITGQLLSQIFANIRLLKNIIKDKVLLSKINRKNIINLAKKYKDFPLHNAPASLVDTITLQMPFIFIAKIANETITGYYFLASRIISFPGALIGRSISQVFFQKISEFKNNDNFCMPLLKETISKLFIIALTFALVMYFISPYIFGLIFGEKWKIAGDIAQYLSLIFFIKFIVSTLSQVLVLENFIKRGSFWQYTYFSSSLILYAGVLYFQIDFFNFLLLLVIHEYILYIYYLYIIISSVQEIDKSINDKGILCVE